MKNISGHPLLSEAAQALSAEELAAHADVAAVLLGLEGHSFTGQDLATARSAIVLQVNRQVAMRLEPDLWMVKSWRRGERSKTYRDMVLSWLDPAAKALADSLLGGDRYGPPLLSRR
jgi:hypothetical protein